MSFKEFCDKWNEIIEFNGNIDNHEAPIEYKESITNIVNIIKGKTDRLDKIEITFIQNCIDEFGIPNMIDLFKDESVIIPEGIFDELPYQLYNSSFEKLPKEYLPIIKTIGIYLIISKANNNKNI